MQMKPMTAATSSAAVSRAPRTAAPAHGGVMREMSRWSAGRAAASVPAASVMALARAMSRRRTLMRPRAPNTVSRMRMAENATSHAKPGAPMRAMVARMTAAMDALVVEGAGAGVDAGVFSEPRPRMSTWRDVALGRLALPGLAAGELPSAPSRSACAPAYRAAFLLRRMMGSAFTAMVMPMRHMRAASGMSRASSEGASGNGSTTVSSMDTILMFIKCM